MFKTIFNLLPKFFLVITVFTALSFSYVNGSLSVNKGFAQVADSTVSSPRIFSARMVAIDPATLAVKREGSSQHIPVKLWGIQPISQVPAQFELSARTALGNVIGSDIVECEVKEQITGAIFAQCVTDDDVDLSLFMIQQGYVSVDRAAILGTIFEDAYIQAEMRAQDEGQGIWGSGGEKVERPDDTLQSGYVLFVMGFVLFLFIIMAFTFVTIVIMRGFKNILTLQNENLNMLSREQRLRNKEREIVSAMLDTEMKANKAKTEAYIVVYDEILGTLKDPDRTPKYKTSGDIVQKQPVLSRSVFDRNTDKIYVLGRQLASKLVEFYAEVKSNPEYINLDPEMKIEDAIRIVEKALSRARQLNQMADVLIDEFERSGVTADVGFNEENDVGTFTEPSKDESIELAD